MFLFRTLGNLRLTINVKQELFPIPPVLNDTVQAICHILCTPCGCLILNITKGAALIRQMFRSVLCRIIDQIMCDFL